MVFMADPIGFLPMAVFYDTSKPEITDDKRSRKESKDDKRASRSRSTLSRFSFRGSSDNLAASPKETAPKETVQESPKKVEDAKATDKKKEEEKEGKQSPFKKWRRSKTVAPESGTATTKSEPIGKPKKESTKKGKADNKKATVEDKGTQEPPVENGTLTEPETSGGEEFF